MNFVKAWLRQNGKSYAPTLLGPEIFSVYVCVCDASVHLCNFFANARVRIRQALKGPLPEGSGFDKEGQPLPLDWSSYETQSGDIYYHRPSTGET